MQLNILYNVVVVLVLIFILIVSFIAYEKKRKNLKKEVPIKDERLTKIVEKSATISFYIGLFSMAFLMVMLIIGYEFFKVPEFGALNVLELEILIMALSYLGIYGYYSKYGTV